MPSIDVDAFEDEWDDGVAVDRAARDDPRRRGPIDVLDARYCDSRT